MGFMDAIDEVAIESSRNPSHVVTGTSSVDRSCAQDGVFLIIDIPMLMMVRSVQGRLEEAAAAYNCCCCCCSIQVLRFA